jgi:hypothetical protein
MAKLFTAADAHIEAPADVVLAILRDFDGHHRRILPPAFSDFEVVHDGLGDGTMTQFKLTLGGRTTEGRTLARETDPGVIREQVLGRDMVTEFRVEPEDAGSRVSIATQWTPAGGFGGLMERFLAPAMLRKVYVQELELLAAYAPSVAGSPTGGGSVASMAASSSR